MLRVFAMVSLLATASSLGLVTQKGEAGDYVGCFDHLAAYRAGNFRAHAKTVTTVQECADACPNSGKYFGLTDPAAAAGSAACYCGDAAGTTAFQSNTKSNCKTCNFGKCGNHGWVISVYQFASQATTTRTCDVADNWRYKWLGSHVEINDHATVYGGETTWSNCLAECRADPKCKQTVLYGPNGDDTGYCYAMNEASSLDQDNKGGSNADFKSAHCSDTTSACQSTQTWTDPQLYTINNAYYGAMYKSDSGQLPVNTNGEDYTEDTGTTYDIEGWHHHNTYGWRFHVSASQGQVDYCKQKCGQMAEDGLCAGFYTINYVQSGGVWCMPVKNVPAASSSSSSLCSHACSGFWSVTTTNCPEAPGNLDVTTYHDGAIRTPDAETGVCGWRLVRFLPAGSHVWHPVSDDLAGTGANCNGQTTHATSEDGKIAYTSTPVGCSAYGDESDFTQPWSVNFGTYDEYVLGSCNHNTWVRIQKDALRGGESSYVNKNTLDASTDTDIVTYRKRSTENYGPDVFFEGERMYMEYGWWASSFSGVSALGDANGGMCVFVRDSSAAESECQGDATAPATCTEVNLARKCGAGGNTDCDVKGSPVFGGDGNGYSYANLNDGVTGNAYKMWHSTGQAAGSEWLSIDLGQRSYVKKLKFWSFTAGVGHDRDIGITLLVSDYDAPSSADYATAMAGQAATQCGEPLVKASPQERTCNSYGRVVYVKGAPSTYLMASELEVFGCHAPSTAETTMTTSMTTTTADTTDDLDALASSKTGLDGWEVVRFVPASAKAWHPATDHLNGNLEGSAYGTPYDYTNAWSVLFGEYDQYLVGPCSLEQWGVLEKSAVKEDGRVDLGTWTFTKQSTAGGGFGYDRKGSDFPHDPIIAYGNHWYDTTLYMAGGYAAPYGDYWNDFDSGLGACVWVRCANCVRLPRTTPAPAPTALFPAKREVNGRTYQKFWWYDTGATWPAGKTDVLGDAYGTCEANDAVCFQRIPSTSVEAGARLLAVDSLGNEVEWTFNAGNAVAHAVWLALFEGQTTSYRVVGDAWNPTLLKGAMTTDTQDTFMYRDQNGIRSFMLDDDSCDCKTTLSMGKGMCGESCSDTYGSCSTQGVDDLDDTTECSAPVQSKGLALYIYTETEYESSGSVGYCREGLNSVIWSAQTTGKKADCQKACTDLGTSCIGFSYDAGRELCMTCPSIEMTDTGATSTWETFAQTTASTPTPTPAPCDASANAKLNDFSSKAAMQAAGWAFDWSDTALWKPLAEFPGAYRGWKHNQDPGTVSATLQGEGTLDLTFGASVSNPVVVKLDGVEKCTASGEETRKECEISYKDGDTISVTETYSVILLHSVTFSCEGSTPAPAPTAEAATPVNVALLCGSGSEACTATQSNTPYGSHSASKALDGNSATTWSGTCTHTSPDDAPSWWKVDLGQVRSIRSVKVVGTSHSELYAKLNAGFTIRVGSDNDYSKNAACATDVTGLSSYTKTVDCIADGQYVSIQISNGALALCEVEVMGVAVATTTEYIVPTLTDWTGNPGCKYGDVDAATMVLDDDADTAWNGHPCRHSTWFMAFDFGEEVTLVAVEGRYGTPTHTPDSLRISTCSSGGSTSSDPAGCTLVAGTTCPIDSENTGYQSCSLGGGGAASRYFKLEWDGWGDSGTYQSVIRDFKFQVPSQASSSSSGSGACPDQTYSGSSCDDCPEGSERDLDLAPTGHSAGTTLRCVAPADALKVEGNRMCYCHGNLPSGNCNRFSEWEKTPSTGQNAGVNFEYVVQPASCASQASAAKGDPHLMNVKGEAFDVMQTGNMMLLEIPRGSSPATLDLALHADIERLGVVTCGPTFITSASITGRWIGVPLEIRSGPIAKKGRHQPKHTFGIRFDGRDWLPHVATQRTIELSKDAKLRAPDRMFRFQVRGLEIAVSQPKRPRIFLDIQVKGLGNLETEIGGLLGIDDHSSVEELPSGCDMPASSLALGAMEEDEALQ